jgi:hypothetical protein
VKATGCEALVGEFTRLSELVTVNGKEWPRQLLEDKDGVKKVDLQGTEIAVAMAHYLQHSVNTLFELDVR